MLAAVAAAAVALQPPRCILLRQQGWQGMRSMASRLPLGSRRTCPRCPRRRYSPASAATSHTTTSVSLDPLASSAPEREKRSADTSLRWPLKVAASSPESRSHSRIWGRQRGAAGGKRAQLGSCEAEQGLLGERAAAALSRLRRPGSRRVLRRHARRGAEQAPRCAPFRRRGRLPLGWLLGRPQSASPPPPPCQTEKWAEQES